MGGREERIDASAQMLAWIRRLDCFSMGAVQCSAESISQPASQPASRAFHGSRLRSEAGQEGTLKNGVQRKQLQ